MKIRPYNEIKKRGWTLDQEKKFLQEVHDQGTHDIPRESDDATDSGSGVKWESPTNLYRYNDFSLLHSMTVSMGSPGLFLRSIDELLEKDKQREKDGFPRKIRVGRLIKPGKGGKEKIVIVPSTLEEKFLHDVSATSQEEEGSSGGAGDGEEGEVIGEQPVRESDTGEGEGPGEGESGAHEMESNAYDLGKILTEKFELPNLKDKGKKKSFTRYTYDLTDQHRGYGQVLDKKATLKKIVETNIALGNLSDVSNIDPTGFLVAPSDKIYRILSREKDYESQAMIFFLRDYSGSMGGKPTQLVVAQHVLIYSWLLYQYARQVETRFILHDTEASEVSDFYTYYNSKVAGGTKVASAYRLVNEIVKKENLDKDYNIYVFHGTDGDDWDTDGKESIAELKKIMSYVSRMGISVVKHSQEKEVSTEVEKYINKSGLLREKASLLRLDAMSVDAEESRLIEGIKTLTSQKNGSNQ